MKGICFQKPLFHAAVKGRKTQHRMIMTLQPDENGYVYPKGHPEVDKISIYDIPALAAYRVGETVYLKEPYLISGTNIEIQLGTEKIFYKYNGIGSECSANKWQNKITMPAKYARYFIEITGLRCEHLQDISDEDCIAEGIFCFGEKYVYDHPNGDRRMIKNTPREAYAVFINKINGKGTWERNPWVWVYDFKLVK